ncbi:hypothetical protein M9Y10_036214 [Tritrichomonas musculus]|uniref:Right handed beta helix domain-containing protein n=1 Tax=Tritrichomonas musculus TaxID=1915356 RepID=A0ABR2GUR7_9EUKA
MSLLFTIILSTRLLFSKNDLQNLKGDEKNFKALSFEGVKGNYVNSNFVNLHKVPASEFSYTASGSLDNFPISNAFDDDQKTFWVSKNENNENFQNYIVVNFKKPITLSAILYDASYQAKDNNDREFNGFPTKLNIYTSIGDKPFKLNSVFTGAPKYPWTRVQFSFSKSVTCEKLLIHFEEVTKDKLFTNSYSAVTSGLVFIQSVSETQKVQKSVTSTKGKKTIKDYSNSEFSGKFSTIHINQDYNHDEVTNSVFTDCSLPDGEEYLFSVKKDFNFDNVDFSFSNSKIGAIKVEHGGKITIRNCVFRRCSVQNGIGNAIYISRGKGKSAKEDTEFSDDAAIVENNLFDQCGSGGYVSSVDSDIIIYRNNTVDFSGIENPSGAFQIPCTGNISIVDCKFIHNKQSGIISYEPISAGTVDNTFHCENCQFTDCIGTCLKLSLLEESKEKITVSACTFENCDIGNDNAIAISSPAQSTTAVLEITSSHFMFTEQKTGKAINVASGELIIKDSNFFHCQEGIEIVNGITNAEIEGCVFSDCYKAGGDAAVIKISNVECTFNNNIVNFTSNENGKSISGLTVTKHGNILITNNQFIRIRKSNNVGAGVSLTDSESYPTAGEVIFNYNTIEDVGNIKYAIFNIAKKNTFSFDHNIIRNCQIDFYSTNIDLSGNGEFGEAYTLTNLTLVQCKAISNDGGSLGVWLKFKAVDGVSSGKLTLKDCYFEGNNVPHIVNNANEQENSGYGGGFAVGMTSVSNLELVVDNCIFIGNHAGKCGGALSIKSNKFPTTIQNSKFINNQADEGGGAIFVHPTKPSNKNYLLLPSCHITNCTFQSNSDASNKGHGIYIQYGSGCSTEIEIDECKFEDNSDYTGYIISADIPTITISNTKIEFTNADRSTSGVFIDTNTNSLTLDNLTILTTNDEQGTYRNNAIEINSHNTISISNIQIDGQFEYGVHINNNNNSPSSDWTIGISNSIFKRNENSVKVSSSIGNDHKIICNLNNNQFKGHLITFDTENQLKIQVTASECTSLNQNNDGSILSFVNYNKLEVRDSEFNNENANPVSFSSLESISDVSFIGVKTNSKPLINIPESVQQSTFNNILFSNCEIGGAAIRSSSPNLEITSSNFIFEEDKSGKAIDATKGILTIKDSNFFRCLGGIEIVNGITNAEIEGCVFSDCYKAGGDAAVIKISNVECTFNNNIVNFTSNENGKSISGLTVTKHGNILITNNQFIRIRKSNNVGAGVSLTDSESYPTAGEVIFNYNTIEDVGNIKYAIFNIAKKNTFSFDHNIIRNCQIDFYSTNIDLSGNGEFGEAYTLTNLTLVQCKAISNDGGSLGVWLKFKAVDGVSSGKLTLKDCYFEGNNVPHIVNNANEQENSGYGGGFAVGMTSVSNLELVVDNCIFIGNHAGKCGGALSIKSNKFPTTIQNSKFINNQADEGGGAIFVHPTKPSNKNYLLLPSCHITNCTFQSNSDASNKGHGIYIQYGSGCSTEIEIDECKFEDNVNSANSNHEGYSISADIPTLIISNTHIIFTDAAQSTAGLFIDTHTNSLNLHTINFSKNHEIGIRLKTSNPLNISRCSFSNVPTGILLDSNYQNFDGFNIESSTSSEVLIKYAPNDLQSTLDISQLTINSLTFSGYVFLFENINEVNLLNSNIQNLQSGSKIFQNTPQILTIDGCNFVSNNLNSDGGALFIDSNCESVTIKNSEFTSNTAGNKNLLKGGAIFIDSTESKGAEVTITNTQFTGNVAGNGSAIYVAGKSARLNVDGGTVFSTNANNGNYFIILENCNLQVTDTTFTCSNSLHPVWFEGVETIQDIQFTNIVTTGSAFIVPPNSINNLNLDNVNFTNCKAQAILNTIDSILTMENSKIEFTQADNANSCPGISFNQYGNHRIISTQFIKTFGAAINYDRKSNDQSTLITISGCTFDSVVSNSGVKRVVSIQTNHNVEFSDNIIKNIEDADYAIAFIFSGDWVTECTIESCQFISNSVRNKNNFSGGSGFWISRGKTLLININFNDCKWISNTATTNSGGGGIQFGPGSLINNQLTFTRCLFEGNNGKIGGALSVSTQRSLTISDCTFKNNYASNQNGYGGALYINPQPNSREDNRIEIVNNTFEGNYAASKNGHVIYFDTTSSSPLIIDSSNTFKNNNNDNGGGSAIVYLGKNLQLEFPTFSDEKKSRFIEFGANAMVSLSDVNFKDCAEKDGNGNAMLINLNAQSVSLTNCNFTNCGESGYIVKDLASATQFINCTFAFDDPAKACCALDISTNLEVIISGCSFINNNNKNDEGTGTLYYHPEAPTGKAKFEYCTFDGCTGNLYKTFSIKAHDKTEFSHITLNDFGNENTPTDYVGQLLIASSTFTIDNLMVRNIISNSKYGGGSAIKLVSLIDSTLALTFDSCKWHDNYAVYSIEEAFANGYKKRYNGIGGAYQQGIDPNVSNVELRFEDCEFLRNKADREGGALAIQTTKIVTVLNCFFKDNIAGFTAPSTLLEDDTYTNMGCGGAIYIDPDFLSDDNQGDRINQFDIQGSQFIHNQAANGHAIYIRGGKRTTLNVLENNVFTDNGKSGTTILSECSNLNVDDDSIFNFTNKSESSRPFDYGAGAIANYDSLQFEDIAASSNPMEGNVINFVDGVLEATVRNCTFTNCGLQGFVVTSNECPLIFENNLIVFDDSTRACKGLGVFTNQNRVEIRNCTFRRCNCYDEPNGGGGLMIRPPGALQTGTYLYLEFVIFDEIYGKNQRCFNINWHHQSLIQQNISIINSPLNGHTGALYLITTAGSPAILELNQWSFKNNQANSKFGGGCGIWIAPNVTSGSGTSRLQLSFDRCEWVSNVAKRSFVGETDGDKRKDLYNGLGGAFQQGFSQSNCDCELTFNDCYFEDNHADSEGGALAIQIIRSCTINNCRFIGNQCGTNNTGSIGSNYSGGAIFIDPDFANELIGNQAREPETKIIGCYFERNTAPTSGLGHSISLTGLNAEVEITDNNIFINNDGVIGSAIYSLCPRLTFSDAEFKGDNKIRAIELEVFGKIDIKRVTFDGLKSNENGGAILLKRAPTQSSTLLAIDKQEYLISNCTFKNCESSGNGGSIYISEGVEFVEIKETIFDSGRVTGDNSQGIALFISIGVTSFTVDSSVKFINQNCNNKFIIASNCGVFDIQDMSLDNSLFGTGVKGIQLNAGTVTINNVVFNKCTGALEINSGVTSATISGCTFNDCYTFNGNSNAGQAVLISNKKCIFTRNTIQFKSNTQASSALYVTNHGDIEITHNQFIKPMKSSNVRSAIAITDAQNDLSEGTVNFQFNRIDNVGNALFGVFWINKRQRFNFDNNIIENCKIDADNGYSCQFFMQYDSSPLKESFTLTNLTLRNCESHSQTGGGFGIWIEFINRIGHFTLKDCKFYDNKCGSNYGGGYGGAFASGNTTVDRMTLTVEDCLFDGNKAAYCGGALSLQSTRPVEIKSSTFRNNEALNGQGGAIFIHPKYDTRLMPSCTISGCTFERNKDSTLTGHAISFIQAPGAQTRFVIEENCVFLDNCIIDENSGRSKNGGYVISSQAPDFEFKDSEIKFTSYYHSTAAMILSGSSNSDIHDIHFYQCCTYDNSDFEAFGVFITSQTNSVRIYDCIFDRLGDRGANAAIYDYGHDTTIDNCQFINEGAAQTGAINVYSYGKHTIQNCFSTYNWGDLGTFQLLPQGEQISETLFTFKNITIDNVNGNNHIALYCSFNSNTPVDFDNVTIRNIEKPNCLVQFDLADDITEFEIHGFNFLNNAVENNYMGGTGMWIQNSARGCLLKFTDCLFDSNTAKYNGGEDTLSGCGGAFSIGKNSDIMNAQIEIRNCKFIENHAKRHGGALRIETTYPVSIDSCEFNGNHADNNGGAIYLDAENGLVNEFNITGCVFKNNYATYDSTFYLSSTENSAIIISDCVFNENRGGKNIIYSRAQNLKVQDLAFEFPDINTNARPLCLGSDSRTEVSNVQFIKCSMNDEEGTAIKAEENSQLIDVHNCKFIDGKSTGSSVEIYASTALFHDNEFTSSSYTKSGLYIYGSSHIEVVDCSFSKLMSNGAIRSPLYIDSQNLNIKLITENLIFSDCRGDNLRCFSVKAKADFSFFNVTVQDNKEGNYLGAIERKNINGATFTFENCTWRNNNCNSKYGGGSGLWLTNDRTSCTFSFENCIFESNYHSNKGGAFQTGYSDTIKATSLNFVHCIFSNNKAQNAGGALAIEVSQPWSIDSCQFNNNTATIGGAIFVSCTEFKHTAERASISKCVFNENVATKEDGDGIILFINDSVTTEITLDSTNKVTNKGEPGSVICSCGTNLILDGLTFDFVKTGNKQKLFRAAKLINESRTTFNGCKFIGTGFRNNAQGQSIYAENADTVIIDDCTFTDCGSVNNKYSIYATSAKEIQFLSSTYSFTDPKVCSPAILVNSWCKFTVQDSTFKNIHASETDNGVLSAAIYYPGKGNKLDCDVKLSGCTFENLLAKNGRAGFFKLAKYSTIKNCTIKNMPDGKHILTIGHEAKEQGQAILENVVFMDNKANCPDGCGGAGLWLSQATIYTITECKFIRNINTGDLNGGVIGYVPSTVKPVSTYKVALEFLDCYFEDNRVKDGFYGGALYINAPLKPVLIDNCVFNNKMTEGAAKRGGAIYISGNTSAKITITNSRFTSMKASESNNYNGNAIHIDLGASDVLIEGCNFVDCGTQGATIFSNGEKVVFSSSTVTFTSTSASCRGVCIQTTCDFELISSTISNCYCSGNGGGFLYRDPITTSNQRENLVFRDTVIENCECGNGRALFLTAATSNPITFQNMTIQHIKTNNGFIFTLGHNKKAPLVEFNQCNFIDCKTNINGGDGGGLGFWCSDEDQIIFSNCLFQQLEAGQNGGAISFTASAPRRDTKMTFDTCTFNQNKADANGCALYIDISAELHVYHCNFTDNFGQGTTGFGGAIFITQNCRNINIEESEFHSNSQNSQAAGHGNAIYFQKQTQLVAFVQKCKFFNCGNNNKGSVVYSDGVDLEFLGNQIQFTQPSAAAKGLHVSTSCDIHIANSSFIGCVTTEGTMGAGFVFSSINSYDMSAKGLIHIDNTIFENNNGTNGNAMLIVTNENPIIKQVTIRGHKNGKFIFSLFVTKDFDEDITIEDCIFEENQFVANNEGSADGGGSGIWVSRINDINAATPVTFQGCTFRNNEASSFGGAVAFGQSGSITNVLLTFQGCIFSNNVAGKKGGALWINTKSLFVIDDCEFISNQVSFEGEGNALILKDRTTSIITDTTFVNNGVAGSAIVFEGKSISGLDSIIEFDLVNESSRGMEIRKKGTIELEGFTFLRCSALGTEFGEGGGIFYHEAITSNDELVFTLDTCVFDANDALNGSALLLNISTAPEIYGCTFKNHQSGSFVFSIVFSMFQMVYEFTDCSFENNYHTSTEEHEDGGGSGIWIANNKQIAAGRLIQIYFTAIKFINNVSPSVGGAFAYGRSPTVYPSELYFDSCEFNGNTAETDGGALWIITKSPYEIQYCNFKNNVANKRGGSIMVDTAAPIATIQTSSFEYDTANEDGNSIYVTEQTPRFILSGNNFIDCGQEHNVITIDTTIAGIEGNTVQFNNEDETCRGLYLKSAGTYEVTDNTFILCKAAQGGGIMFDNVNQKPGNETLIFSRNTFDSCIATDTGCAMYLHVNLPPTFDDNNVDNCRHGTRIITVVFIKEITEYVLSDFTFQNNEISNARGREDTGGSGFWIDNANNRPFDFTFRNVKFIGNTAVYAGGGFAFGSTQAYRSSKLYFDQCQFIDNRCKEELGGALWIGSEGDVVIDSCVFTNNKALGVHSYGGAIYFDPSCTSKVLIINTVMTKNSAIDGNALYLPSSLSEVVIKECNLLNNGNLNSSVYSICPYLVIEDSSIGFEKYSLKSRAIEILTRCNVSIKNTNFTNCDAGEGQKEGGGIRYKFDGVSARAAVQESIVIEDCIFTNCKGGNGVACMIWSEGNVVFNRNTIQDCRCGKFIFVIISSTFVENFQIEDCIFKHNLFNNNGENKEDGGGSGIWIANHKERIPQGSYTHLKFKNCQWLENQASAVGGAFAYGRSETIVNTAITFEKCRFLDNTAKSREGGALWIATSVPFLVEDCFFLRNKAAGDSAVGGAITVAATAPQINIKGTTFQSNEAREGNAIYVRQTTNDMNITDCNFLDNGVYGSVITNEAKQICIDTCYIQFTSHSKASRGVKFISRSFALVRDTHFVNCKTSSTEGGAAAFYENQLQTTDEESLTFEGCLFNNCQGPNGCAILAWLDTPIILRNNLIWHNTNGKYIVSIFYGQYVNETVIEDCYFEHNSFYNDDTNRDGGGSGLWVAHKTGFNIPEGEETKLTFVGCTWRNNTADAYGGAFSYGKSPRTKSTVLEFNDCIFINNSATKTYGGALYIITDKPAVITDCFFDGNKARGIGGAVYFSKYGDVSITDCKFARNKASEGGAICADGRNKVKLDSLVFSENTVDNDAVNLLIRHYGDSQFDVKNCKFDFEKNIGQASVCVRNNNYENSVQTVNFEGCCFTHKGDAIDTVTHIKTSLVSGEINLGAGNCFDTPEELAISYNNETTNITVADGIFSCTTCTVPTIPTSPPTNMPTQSPSPTPEATPRPTDNLPDPTPKQTLEESTPLPPRTPARSVTPLATHTTSQSQEPIVPTSGDETPSISQSRTLSVDGSVVSKGKSKAKKIGMIAGITAAITVVIVVALILVWLFFFRNRPIKSGINDEGFKPNTLDNEANPETETTTPGAAVDDPIWSYQSQENPLYNENGNDGEGNAFDDDNNNFEESWGNAI